LAGLVSIAEFNAVHRASAILIVEAAVPLVLTVFNVAGDIFRRFAVIAAVEERLTVITDSIAAVDRGSRNDATIVGSSSVNAIGDLAVVAGVAVNTCRGKA